MVLTSIRIKRFVNTTTKLKGVVSLTLDDMMVIHDVKVLQNDLEVSLAMPSKQTKQGSFKDIVHPINREVRAALEKLVFYGYKYAVDGGYSQVDMVLVNSDDANLLTQEYSDFQISGTTYGHTGDASTDESVKTPQPGKNADLINNNVLRWLES